ncbi:MAG: M23 family metallopeptidase [Anaerolineales bacterium]|nr:MAG: M23 family metallopeptidase [Anaerolineales bacterium]
MYRALILFVLFIIASCVPVPAPVETVAVLPSAASTEFAFTPISTSTPTTMAPTFTPTQIPCDPLTADFCIIDWKFPFHAPILPPDTDSVDGTYRYGSTQSGARDPHHGVEFQNRFGTPVYAAGDGVVVFADPDKTTKFSPWTNFYGNMVLIRHAGDFYTLYAHLSNIFVQAGSQIKAGERIGEVGQTGGATGSHLHFEVRRGGAGTDYFSTENPELWLIPAEGTGTLAITLKVDVERNYERPLVVTRFLDGSTDPLFVYYLSSYTKGFEHNEEDAVLGSLPPGRYKVAFSDGSGLRERIVLVEAGKLTQVVFEKK